MIETQRPAFTATAEVNTRLYESIAAATKEWASFINQRLKEHLAMPRQLAECKNLQASAGVSAVLPERLGQMMKFSFAGSARLLQWSGSRGSARNHATRCAEEPWVASDSAEDRCLSHSLVPPQVQQMRAWVKFPKGQQGRRNSVAVLTRKKRDTPKIEPIFDGKRQAQL